MAIKQTHVGAPGSEQGLGVDVGAQAGTGSLGNEAQSGATSSPRATAPHGSANLADMNDADHEASASSSIGMYQSGIK